MPPLLSHPAGSTRTPFRHLHLWAFIRASPSRHLHPGASMGPRTAPAIGQEVFAQPCITVWYIRRRDPVDDFKWVDDFFSVFLSPRICDILSILGDFGFFFLGLALGWGLLPVRGLTLSVALWAVSCLCGLRGLWCAPQRIGGVFSQMKNLKICVWESLFQKRRFRSLRKSIFVFVKEISH